MSSNWFHVFMLAAYGFAFQQASTDVDSEFKFWLAAFMCWMCLSASAALTFAILIAGDKSK